MTMYLVLLGLIISLAASLGFFLKGFLELLDEHNKAVQHIVVSIVSMILTFVFGLLLGFASGNTSLEEPPTPSSKNVQVEIDLGVEVEETISGDEIERGELNTALNDPNASTIDMADMPKKAPLDRE